MTIPEPVSPEVRRSPDGRLIAYCRSARHGLWRKSDGYDCDTEDVADWTPLVPAVSPAPDTDELRPLVEAAVRQGIKDWDRDYDSRACGPITNYVLGALDYALRTREAGLRADLDRVGKTADDLLRAYEQEHAKVERLTAELAGARTIPDDAAEQVHAAVLGVAYSWPTLADAVTRQVMRTLQSWQTPKLAALFSKPDPWATPTTGPAPAAADVQWGVQRADGVLDQMDDEADAREHLHWFDAGSAQVVSRTVVYGPWTPAPAAPQDPAEPTDDYGDDVRVPGPLAPVDTPIGDFLTEHPEVANARVRIWFCPAHRDGTVDWRGDTAHCTTDDCDLTSTTLKTPAAWSVLDHVTIHDPDGWRRDGKPFSEPITHTEFMRRLMTSTIERHVPASLSRAHAHGEVPRG